MNVATRQALGELYAKEIHERALRSTAGDQVRADIARREAVAQFAGDYGPEGSAVFELWLEARGFV